MGSPAGSVDGHGPRLREIVSRAVDFEEGGLAALEFLLEDGPLPRACLLVRSGGHVRGVGWHVSEDRVAAIEAAAREGTPLASAFDAAGPQAVEVPPPPATLDGFAPTFAVPLDGAPAGEGLLLLEEPGTAGDTATKASLLAEAVPQLGRLVELEALRGRVAELGRQVDTDQRILDGIPDPILLANVDGDILMTNARAEELFFPAPDDSEGRSRAVQFNAFHLNVTLTEMDLDDEPGGNHELTLADPRDGSDLHFEVLPTRLRGTGDRQRLVLNLRDITDLRQAVSQLELENKRARLQEHRTREESRRVSAILENAADPILVTDTGSDIVLMNREAERLFGDPKEDPATDGGEVGRDKRANVTKLTSFVNDLLLRDERRRTARLAMQDPAEGSELPAEVVATKVLDDRNEPMAVVTVLRDLSPLMEKQRMARQLQELNEELERRVDEAVQELEERNRLLEWQSHELKQASRLKSQFLANMSHELRTPINAMLGYTSLMQDRIYGSLTGEQERALQKVNAASEHLLDLINDILDLSKIEAGKMPLEIEETGLPELVDEISKTVEPMLRRKDLALRTELAGDLPVLRTDRTKLRQVLLNLLENGIKYTSEGWVAVRGRPSREGDAVRIEVEDTGKGMREEHLEVIFEDFRQVDASRTREHGGTGLGLAISRKLVSLMGGIIEAESEHGEGTRFILELPVELDPDGISDPMDGVLAADPGPESPRTSPGAAGGPVPEGDTP